MTPLTETPVTGSADSGPASESADIVQRLKLVSFCTENIYYPPVAATAAEAADTITELRSRVAELEKDAKRYRWLRNQPRKLPAGQSGIMACKWEADGTGFDLVKSELDAAIDAARKE